ncbi:hypothetical protein K437DRAFT_169880 [Tilletiaria anomala UBC 951]|uniref:BZIP domain-containing protein n=1 Tax=Tilletiaria anomala (strain ATCC 24038 / CBS 436.72 / UBC 951) TaxID=1037660 RepID=A0A066VNM7_TILAU|nr:uncharacterized protein K437DRAFT_169880 [Tilletiaria anomala UBC 951]KDN41883.1 hypothetical protein K437DRAFT_169880 [Tilletiaria anomala UBC 951]
MQPPSPWPPSPRWPQVTHANAMPSSTPSAPSAPQRYHLATELRRMGVEPDAAMLDKYVKSHYEKFVGGGGSSSSAAVRSPASASSSSAEHADDLPMADGDDEDGESEHSHEARTPPPPASALFSSTNAATATASPAADAAQPQQQPVAANTFDDFFHFDEDPAELGFKAHQQSQQQPLVAASVAFSSASFYLEPPPYALTTAAATPGAESSEQDAVGGLAAAAADEADMSTFVFDSTFDTSASFAGFDTSALSFESASTSASICASGNFAAEEDSIMHDADPVTLAAIPPFSCAALAAPPAPPAPSVDPSLVTLSAAGEKAQQGEEEEADEDEITFEPHAASSSAVPEVGADIVPTATAQAALAPAGEDGEEEDATTTPSHAQAQQQKRSGSAGAKTVAPPQIKREASARDGDAELDALLSGESASLPAGIPASMRFVASDLRPTPEEYKRLSSKEKRQLRNKISARNFRNRRKEYITQLEEQLHDREDQLARLEAAMHRVTQENDGLRAQVLALKSRQQQPQQPQQPALGGRVPILSTVDVNKIIELLQRNAATTAAAAVSADGGDQQISPNVPVAPLASSRPDTLTTTTAAVSANSPRLAAASTARVAVLRRASNNGSAAAAAAVAAPASSPAPAPASASTSACAHAPASVSAGGEPTVNTRKDLGVPTSGAGAASTSSFWGGSGGRGGYTSVHTTLLPPLRLATVLTPAQMLMQMQMPFAPPAYGPGLSAGTDKACERDAAGLLAHITELYVSRCAASKNGKEQCLGAALGDSSNTSISKQCVEDDELPSYAQALAQPPAFTAVTTVLDAATVATAAAAAAAASLRTVDQAPFVPAARAFEPADAKLIELLC